MKASNFLGRLPLSVKMACTMLIAVIASLTVVILYESEHFKDIFLDYRLETHNKTAQEQLYRLVDLLRINKNNIKTFISQKNFIEYFDQKEKNGWPDKVLHHNYPPGWFPSTSILREYYHNSYAMLLDGHGKVRETFQNLDDNISYPMVNVEMMLPRFINTESIITNVKDKPFQIVMRRIYGEGKRLRGILIFVFPVNMHFIRSTQGTMITDTEIALLDENDHVVASSNIDMIPRGTDLTQLEKTYYISKKTFFEYGESEVELNFVSLLPKSSLDVMFNRVSHIVLRHGLLYGSVLISISTLIVFLLSNRLRKLTGETVHFVKNNLGIPYSLPAGGDELLTLERSFHQMKEKIAISQNSLLTEKERLAVTLGAIADAVIATDIEGKILLINKVAEGLTGWSERESVGMNLSAVVQVFDEKKRERCSDLISNIIFSGQAVDIVNNAVLIQREGTERLVDISGAPIKDNNSKIIGIVVVFRDVTEKRRTEEQLFNAKKLESIAILAAGIAHEINNPLTNAYLNLQILKGRLTRKDDEKDILNKFDAVERNVDRASVIARELLEFSKQKESEFIPVNLADLLKDVISLVEYNDKNIVINQEVEDVPDIIGDAVRLEQVFINILNNSFDAMPDGGKIDISISNDDRNVEIKIQDNGEGISDEVISRVFDPFFTTKDIGGGTGLGLAICYGIIKMHNGTIEISSIYRKGTAVIVKIPTNGNNEANTGS